MAYCDRLLAVLTKLRPVLGYQVFVGDFAPFFEHIETGRGQRFGRGHQDEHCLVSNRLAVPHITAMDVQHQVTIAVYCQTGPRMVSIGNLLLEQDFDLFQFLAVHRYGVGGCQCGHGVSWVCHISFSV